MVSAANAREAGRVRKQPAKQMGAKAVRNFAYFRLAKDIVFSSW
jgi:hypothetical protein